MGLWHDEFCRRAKKNKFPIFTPYYKLSQREKDILWHGSDEERRLPEEQQVKARAILEEARPAIEDTRWRIRQKREELAHFDYAEDSSAETLSRLGWELQDLRDRLRLQLAQLEGRLLDEVGVSFRRAGKSRGCNSMIRQDVIHTYSLQETLEPCP